MNNENKSGGSKMKGHSDVKLWHTLGHILNDTIGERNSYGLILWSNSSLVTRAADLKLIMRRGGMVPKVLAQHCGVSSKTSFKHQRGGL